MNQTQASRLLTLAHFLKTQVPDEEFEMDHYGHREVDVAEGNDTPDFRSVGLGEKCPALSRQLICNTSACALGWCTEIWPDRMRMDWGNEPLSSEGDSAAGGIQFKTESGRWLATGYTAQRVLGFFGVTKDEAYELFAPDNRGVEEIYDHIAGCYRYETKSVPHTTPKVKAKQIEELVESKGWTYAK